MIEPTKKELDELLITSPSSELSDQRKVVEELVPADIVDNGSIFWKKISNDLLTSHDNGVSFGRFGNNNLNNRLLLKRIGDEIKNMITQEYAKKQQTTENLSLQFTILFGILDLIAKDLDTKNVSTQALVANLHGFVNSYVKNLK